MFKAFASCAVGALAGVAISLSATPTAAQTAINPGGAFATHRPELVQTIDYHRRGIRPRYDDRRYDSRRYDRRRYDRRLHGERYRNPRGAYRYRYTDGYYYANPWWTLGLGLGLGGVIAPEPVRPHRVRPVAPRSAGAHVDWCFDRYRSYTARTDTFTGYDGVVRRCRSPYR